MIINFNTKIIGQRVMLVPYTLKHVPKYHMWMKSEELQKLTASEPLTLEEEYRMQKSWQQDEDKCTFIILDKKTFEGCQNEIDAMIGDTNIFITDRDETKGEIEIMIAEPQSRGSGLGWESVILMLIYGIEGIKIKKYEAKINMENATSIKLFQKLGFTEMSRSEVFAEITYVKEVTSDWLSWLKDQFKYKVDQYR